MYSLTGMHGLLEAGLLIDEPSAISSAETLLPLRLRRGTGTLAYDS
jgi:hypothetical protein